MVNKPKISDRMLENASLEELARMFAESRGQEGREVSDRDIEQALQLLQNKNKKFFN